MGSCAANQSFFVSGFVDGAGGSLSSVIPPNALQLAEVDGAHRILHIHRNQPGVLAELNRALAAAGQGPKALERGDESTQTAGPTRQGAYPGLDFRPPPEVRKEALRGLQLRKENERRGKRVDPKTGAGPGGWWIGVGRAIQLATLPAMPPREITRMRDYFRRHAADVKSAGAVRGQATPGVVAWLLWGGDASRDWSRDLAGQMDRRDAEREGGRKGARFARGETGPRTKHPRTGSRALAAVIQAGRV